LGGTKASCIWGGQLRVEWPRAAALPVVWTRTDSCTADHPPSLPGLCLGTRCSLTSFPGAVQASLVMALASIGAQLDAKWVAAVCAGLQPHLAVVDVGVLVRALYTMAEAGLQVSGGVWLWVGVGGGLRASTPCWVLGSGAWACWEVPLGSVDRACPCEGRPVQDAGAASPSLACSAAGCASERPAPSCATSSSSIGQPLALAPAPALWLARPGWLGGS
jgi:hypothetical protein